MQRIINTFFCRNNNYLIYFFWYIHALVASTFVLPHVQVSSHTANKRTRSVSAAYAFPTSFFKEYAAVSLMSDSGKELLRFIIHSSLPGRTPFQEGPREQESAYQYYDICNEDAPSPAWTPFGICLNLVRRVRLEPPVKERQVGWSEIAFALVIIIVPSHRGVREVEQPQQHPLVPRGQIPVSGCEN